jgi:hypothetical protein
LFNELKEELKENMQKQLNEYQEHMHKTPNNTQKQLNELRETLNKPQNETKEIIKKRCIT